MSAYASQRFRSWCCLFVHFNARPSPLNHNQIRQHKICPLHSASRHGTARNGTARRRHLTSFYLRLWINSHPLLTRVRPRDSDGRQIEVREGRRAEAPPLIYVAHLAYQAPYSPRTAHALSSTGG